MFSVIIQNEKTSFSFSEYELLFAQHIEDGAIAACRWIEGGDTIEKTVPELYDTIAGHEKWRAIIVQAVLEDDADHPSDPRNPYDFQGSRTEHDSMRISPFPLVRLTHMLGGVPAPEVVFKREDINEEGKVTKICYVPEKDEEAHDRHRRLEEKYVFRESRPEEIILISIRRKAEEEDDEHVREAWNKSLETESSYFWQRNHYPNKCRFLAYDIYGPGHSRYAGDMFTLWLGVLLISTNRIEPATLQAYRLYKLSVDLDKAALEGEFQRFTDSLGVAAKILRESAEGEKKPEFGEPFPEIKEEIPVVFHLGDTSKLYIETKGIGLAKDCPADEEGLWHSRRRASELALQTVLKTPMRALKASADHVREQSKFDIRHVEKLSGYQAEDMEEFLEETYLDLLKSKREIGFDPDGRKKELNEIDAGVRKRIRSRLTRKRAVAGGGAAMLLFFAGFLPYIFRSATGPAAFFAALGTALGALCLMGVCGIVALYVFRRDLRESMESYNFCLSGVMSDVMKSAQRFSKFLSGVCTYMRGRSYFACVDELEKRAEGMEHMRCRHLGAIEECGEMISRWGASLGARIDRNMTGIISVDFDIMIPPERNYLYRLPTPPAGKDIPINRTGATIKSPYRFLSRITIEREELYEYLTPPG